MPVEKLAIFVLQTLFIPQAVRPLDRSGVPPLPDDHVASILAVCNEYLAAINVQRN